MQYILIAGNGETSRANVEALMEDVFYAKPDTTVVLAYESAPSKGQTFVAQYSAEAKKDLIVFCHDNAQTTGIPGATQNSSNSPIVSSIEFLANQTSTAYLLYSENDSDSVLTLARCVEAGIRVQDLCDGLVPLHSAPEMPPPPSKIDAPQIVFEEPSTVPAEDIVAEIKGHLNAAIMLFEKFTQSRI
jgi:hypothetical protein